MAKKCECTGPVCSCGAEGIVKDGAAVRVQLSAMDAAPSQDGPNLVGDAGESWGKVVFDKAGVPLKSDNDNGSPQKEKQPVADAGDHWSGPVDAFNQERER